MSRLNCLGMALAAVCLLVGAQLPQTDPPIAPPDKALLIVRVPADATVTIGGKLMTLKGTQRTFITPALEGLKPEWEEAARNLEEQVADEEDTGREPRERGGHRQVLRHAAGNGEADVGAVHV